MTYEFDPIVGQPVSLAPGLTLVLAPNASAMTHLGTNTYLLGRETLAVIDPGPDSPAHLKALRSAIAERPVTHIFVTHSHLDHSPLAGPLSQETGAPVLAFGNSKAGRSAIMEELAQGGFVGGGEGIDREFAPTQVLEDGDVVTGSWGALTAIHTPGHLGNHLCLAWGKAIFTGDHVMGWASSLVSPPDGDLTDFIASCRKLQLHHASVYYPGHGAPITKPEERLAWLISHRINREKQILKALKSQSATPEQITKEIYHDVPKGLLHAAERNVFAHLIDLYQRGAVTALPNLSQAANFALQVGNRSD